MNLDGCLLTRKLTRVQYEKLHLGSISSNKHDWPERAEEVRSQCSGAECGKRTKSHLLGLSARQAAFATVARVSKGLALCTSAWCRRGCPCYSIHQMKSLRPTSLQERTPCSLLSNWKAVVAQSHSATQNRWLKGHRMAQTSKNNPRSLDVVRPKDVPRGRVRCEKEYQQAHWINWINWPQQWHAKASKQSTLSRSTVGCRDWTPLLPLSMTIRCTCTWCACTKTPQTWTLDIKWI